MPIPLVITLALAALFGSAVLYFYSVVQMRDQVRRPEEKIYGTGLKRALLIFQPSCRGGGARVAQAVARALAHAGHTVTVNRPSKELGYDPMAYDLLIFGGSAYMGGVGRPLVDYLSGLRFTGKKVLLYVVGEADKAPELAGLRLCVPTGNAIRTIKVSAGEAEKLAEFAVG